MPTAEMARPLSAVATRDGATGAPLLDRSLRSFFGEIARVSLSRPAQALFFARTVLHQIRAARIRAGHARAGLRVPPIVIFSITNRCNLRCKGCYAQAIRGDARGELSPDHIRRIIGDAEALGVSFFVIVGGEPLIRPEFLDIPRDFPRLVFLLATNGTLLDGDAIRRLVERKNVVPVLSMEGHQAETDARRGGGVHAGLRRAMRDLKRAGAFFAVSLTVTRANFHVVTQSAFVEETIEAGCRFFLFLEYTPVSESTEAWVITGEQRAAMRSLVAGLRQRFDAVFIAVPWDEEEHGGCLASGRGFVHIDPSGALEPCPFAPYSDVSLRDLPLKEALRSRFLAAMRENHDSFRNHEGGCALWSARDQVQALLHPDGSVERPGETPQASKAEARRPSLEEVKAIGE
jgi:MoaA/NifB/PqqE/SkfB family radical SAM enzyme